MRPSPLHATITGLMLLLAGCAELDQRQIPTAPPQPPRPPQQVEEIPSEPEEPLPPVPDRKPAPQVARTEIQPDRLIGLSTFQTESLLGIPALEDERPPAKVWTYNAKNCVLSIFFYPDINTRVFQALTYEFNEEVKTDAAKRRCLEELVREHAS